MQSERNEMGTLPPSLSGHAGNIAAWKKKEGEEVAAGDSIAEIETDKASPLPAEHLRCSNACPVPSCTACPVKEAGISPSHPMHRACNQCGHVWTCLQSAVAAPDTRSPGCVQATMDWESQDDGFIAKLLVEDGAKDLAVGDPVLVFVEDEVRNTGFLSALANNTVYHSHKWMLVSIMATTERLSQQHGRACLHTIRQACKQEPEQTAAVCCTGGCGGVQGLQRGRCEGRCAKEEARA